MKSKEKKPVLEKLADIALSNDQKAKKQLVATIAVINTVVFILVAIIATAFTNPPF